MTWDSREAARLTEKQKQAPLPARSLLPAAKRSIKSSDQEASDLANFHGQAGGQVKGSRKTTKCMLQKHIPNPCLLYHHK